MDRTELVRVLASMTDAEYQSVSSEARGPANVRQSISQKAAQLLNEVERDHNGPVGVWAATVAARAPQPQPQPEQPPAPTGFTANRAQSASGDNNLPAPAQQADWSTKPRIYPPGGAF
jgi:hypothetical protein